MHDAKTLLFSLLIGLAGAATAQTAPAPQVIDHETAGNLAATHALGCLAPTAIESAYTPADLYPAAAACVTQGRTEEGITSYVVAGAYAQFDALRVTDETAHDAPTLLRMRAFQGIDAATLQRFEHALLASLQNDATHHALCRRLLHLGPPTYFPRYMVQHGMAAFVNPGANTLKTPFDAAAGWLGVMKHYAHCDVVLPR